MKRLYNTSFGIYKENGHLVFKFFGIKISCNWANINRLEDICSICNIPQLLELNTRFPHPIGIVIHPKVRMGRNCTIYQNVTIGRGKYIEKNHSDTPILGDNVTIYANAVLTNGIKVGSNVIVGAGSVVIHDIPDNSVVAGNPARIVNKYHTPT